jgi:hypothetical protein
MLNGESYRKGKFTPWGREAPPPDLAPLAITENATFQEIGAKMPITVRGISLKTAQV